MNKEGAQLHPSEGNWSKDLLSMVLSTRARFSFSTCSPSHQLMLLNCVVLEKTLESPLDCKEIQPVHPKGDQSWVFIGRNDEAATPILWPPDAKSWLIGKDPDAGKDWGQEKGMKRGWDGWMASLTQWTWVWVDSGRWWWTGGLVCYCSRGRKELDMTEQLNWTEQKSLSSGSLHKTLILIHHRARTTIPQPPEWKPQLQ